MSQVKNRRSVYEKKQLIEAIRAVSEGKMSSVHAAQTYKVPQSTIRSHTNNSFLRIGAGRPYYLDSKEEGYLIDLIQSLESIGVRLTRKVLSKIVGEYIGSVTRDSRFTSEWVCVGTDTKDVYEDNGGNSKKFTTVVVCGNAAGIALPSYTIYAAKNVNKLWCKKGPERGQYNCSNKGWITRDLFIDWFTNLFLVETAHLPRPLILLMDNLSAHISIKCIELAQQHQIILLCLPPNTTHALQPLDVVTFGVAKNKWRTLVSTYFRKKKRKSIRKMDFPQLLNDLYSSSFSTSTVSGGFRRAGVWPFDADAMKEKVIRRCSTYNNTVTNKESASDILTFLANVTQASDIDTSGTNNSSAPIQMDVDSPSSSAGRQRTFDDTDDDEESDSYDADDNQPVKKQKTAHQSSPNRDSDERLDSFSNLNTANVTRTSTSTSANAQRSPRSVVRSIVSFYSQDSNIAVHATQTKSNSRIRAERRFGEDITNSNLLEELKKKAEEKKTKIVRNNVAQQSTRSTRKKD